MVVAWEAACEVRPEREERSSAKLADATERERARPPPSPSSSGLGGKARAFHTRAAWSVSGTTWMVSSCMETSIKVSVQLKREIKTGQSFWTAT